MAQPDTEIKTGDDSTKPLEFSRKRFMGDAEMDITPMIDIVFLLLIFFLVASKMDEAASVNLPEAQRGIEVSQENAIVVIVTKREGEVVVQRRDGSAFAEDLERQDAEIGEYVDAGLTGSPPFDRPMESIILKAQADVREGDVARVAESIGRVTEMPLINYAVLEQQ
jgi:biopolymer transport protein ExbD